MSNKKQQGHYCKICGARKANECFGGKGHAMHICKDCEALPPERKAELQYMNKIERMAMKYPRKREDWDFLEKMAKNRRYPEAAEFAASFLERGYSATNDEDGQDWSGDPDVDQLPFA